MQPTINEINFAKNFVTYLMNNDFRRAVTYELNTFNNYTRGVYNWLDEGGESILKGFGFYSAYGETKLCLIPECFLDFNWVIKVGFLTKGVGGRNEENMCQTELDNYHKACDNNLGEYFASMYELCTIDDVTFFMQEKVMVDCDSIEDKFYTYIREQMDIEDYEDEDQFNDACWNRIFDMEDDERIEALIDSCDVSELIHFILACDINDLHQENWGYRKNGKIILIDYSGYRG